MTDDLLENHKQSARAWFETLQTRIIAAFEAIEADYGGQQHGELPPGKFERKSWQRPRDTEGPNAGQDRGGGVMSVMKGRVFEKVGVNVSTVFGEFSPEFRKQMPGAADDPRFYATGISLVAHLRSPLVPAALSVWHPPHVVVNRPFALVASAALSMAAFSAGFSAIFPESDASSAGFSDFFSSTMPPAAFSCCCSRSWRSRVCIS